MPTLIIHGHDDEIVPFHLGRNLAAAIPQAKFVPFDEPTSALDPYGKANFWEYISARTSNNACVVIATHDLLEAQSRANKVCILDDGNLIVCDSPKAIIAKHNSTRWQLTLQEEDGMEYFTTVLRGLQGSTRVEVERNRLWISMESGDFDDNKFLQLANQNNVQITEINKRLPDLSTAYFDITGRSGQLRPRAGNNKKT